MVRRNYWLKREDTEKKNTKERDDKKEDKKARQRLKVDKVFSEDEERPEKPAKKLYTLDELDKRIVEIVEKRAGRKISAKEKKVTTEEDLDALQEFYEKVQNDEIKKVEVNFFG